MSQDNSSCNDLKLSSVLATDLGRLTLCAQILSHLGKIEQSTPTLLIKEDIAAIQRLISISSEEEVTIDNGTSSQLLERLSRIVICRKSTAKDFPSKLFMLTCMSASIGFIVSYLSQRWSITVAAIASPLLIKYCNNLLRRRSSNKFDEAIRLLIDSMKRHKTSIKNACNVVEVSVDSNMYDERINLAPDGPRSPNVNHAAYIVESIHRLIRDSLCIYRESTKLMLERNSFSTNPQNDDPSNYLCLIPDVHLEHMLTLEVIDLEEKCSSRILLDNAKKVYSLAKLTCLQMSELLRRLMCVLYPNSYRLRPDPQEVAEDLFDLFIVQNFTLFEMISRLQLCLDDNVTKLSSVKLYHKFCYSEKSDIIIQTRSDDLHNLGFNDAVVKPLSSSLLSASHLIESLTEKLSLQSNSSDTQKLNRLNDISSNLHEIKKISVAIDNAVCLGESMITRLRHPQKLTLAEDIKLSNEPEKEEGDAGILCGIFDEKNTQEEADDVFEVSVDEDNKEEDDFGEDFERKWRHERHELYKDQRGTREANDLFGELAASFNLPVSESTMTGSDTIIGEGECDEE